MQSAMTRRRSTPAIQARDVPFPILQYSKKLRSALFAQVAAIFWKLLETLHIVSCRHVETLKDMTHIDQQTKREKNTKEKEWTFVTFSGPHLFTHVP